MRFSMRSFSTVIRLDSGKEVRVRIRYCEGELFTSVTGIGGPVTMEEVYEARDKLNRLLNQGKIKPG